MKNYIFRGFDYVVSQNEINLFLKVSPALED
jgi:hypothetical protein